MAKEFIEREALEVALNHRLNFLMAENGEYDHYTSGFDEAVTRVENFPAADVVPAVELEDLRAKYQALVAEKDKSSGDTVETYTTGYRYGHRNGQIELLQEILGICDSVSELEKTNE